MFTRSKRILALMPSEIENELSKPIEEKQEIKTANFPDETTQNELSKCVEENQDIKTGKIGNISIVSRNFTSLETISYIERRGRPKGSKKKKKIAPKALQIISDVAKDGSGNESDNASSENGTRPNSPDSGNDSQRKKKRKQQLPKLEIKTRGAKIPNFAEQIKQSHWGKKDLDTIYGRGVSKKCSASESENSSDSYRNKYKDEISDVSDAEEPELKKLKYGYTNDPMPSDNKVFQRYTKMECLSPLSWMTMQKRKSNPLHWSVNDVYNYFLETDDCRILAAKLKEEEIDGHALVLLDVPTLEEFLHLRPRYAVLLCNHINKIKNYGYFGR